ncbi:MAG TPA: hypothetical protein VGL81_18040 [Polyangiaceae bacterium]
MRAQGKRRLAGMALGCSVGGAVAAVGCSLGLDHSLIGADAGDDGSNPVEASGDSPVKPSGDGQAPPADAKLTIDAGACTVDSDCTKESAPAGACVSAAKCDPTWHVCLLTTCSVGACKAAVCNTGNLTCSVPTTYGFEATQFSVSTGGVGAGVRYSIAAAWPFVFVVTTNGVVAYNVVDPTNSDPPVVPLSGVPFIPIATLALGRRVYFFNGTQGNGPTYRQAVAWVDVPQDPLVAGLAAVSAFTETAQQGVSNVLTNGTNGAYVVYNSGMASPTANVAPPLDDSTQLASFPNPGIASGASIIASTGPRLLTYRYDSPSMLQNYALISGPGTAAAQTLTEQAITAYGPMANQAALTTGDDGSLLWNGAILALDDAGASEGISSARLTWMLSSGTDTNFATAANVDLEDYNPPTGAFVTGPAVWLDANTALGLAAASSASTDTTSVQLVTKSPPTVAAGTRTLISVAPSSVGAAASGGFAYVLAQDDAKNETCSVYIFAPACGSSDP